MKITKEKIQSLLPQELLSDCISEGYSYNMLIDEDIFSFELWKDRKPEEIINFRFPSTQFGGKNAEEIRRILQSVVNQSIVLLEEDEPS